MSDISAFPDLTDASKALATADAEFTRRQSEFNAYAAEYTKLRGGAIADGNLLQTLLRAYGPKLATYFGIPGAAAGLTALTADPGAFAGLKTVAGKLLGLFGFGG